LVLFLRDAGIALLFVGFILLAMFAYSGLWPPLVVVESNSMMHGDDNTSHIGAIDTGDLVLVKKVNQPSDITTYMEGLSTGHKTYGDYGDVVIYKKGGSDTLTPIIHRALIYLEPNADGLSYRSASLRDAPDSAWSTYPVNDTWDHLAGTLVLKNVSYNHVTIQIDIGNVIRIFEGQGIDPKPGFITKGDHNLQTDQVSWGPGPVVEFKWIVGKASGEIPWFGLLKLWSTHSLGSPAPDNSVRDLWISLALIIISPIAVDIILTIRERRLGARKTSSPGQDEPPREEKTLPPNPPGPS
jgi:signal peptidase